MLIRLALIFSVSDCLWVQWKRLPSFEICSCALHLQVDAQLIYRKHLVSRSASRLQRRYNFCPVELPYDHPPDFQNLPSPISVLIRATYSAS